MFTVVIALVVVACAGTDSGSDVTPVSDWEVVSAGTIVPGDPVPLPDGEPVLRISGMVSNTNQGNAIELDLATLEQMPLVKLEVVEPFEERTIVFEGVLMSDLMAAVGADPQARETRFIALDDYAIEIPLTEFQRTDVLLATKADGEHMSVDGGGPTRIVFPPDSEFGESSDTWIWSVKTIVVR